MGQREIGEFAVFFLRGFRNGCNPFSVVIKIKPRYRYPTLFARQRNAPKRKQCSVGGFNRYFDHKLSCGSALNQFEIGECSLGNGRIHFIPLSHCARLITASPFAR